MGQIRRMVVEYAMKATTGGQGLDKVIGMVQSAVAQGSGSAPDIGKLLAGANLPSLDPDVLMQRVTQAVHAAAPLLAGLRGAAPAPASSSSAGARSRPAPPPVQTDRRRMPSVLGGPRRAPTEEVHAPALAAEPSAPAPVPPKRATRKPAAPRSLSKSTPKAASKAASKAKATTRKTAIKAPTFAKAKAASPKRKPAVKPTANAAGKPKPKAAGKPTAKAASNPSPKPKAPPRPRAAAKPAAKAKAAAKPAGKAKAARTPKSVAKPKPATPSRAARRSPKI